MTSEERRNHNVMGQSLKPGLMVEFAEAQGGEEWGSRKEVLLREAVFIAEKNGLYLFEPMNGVRNPRLVKMIFPQQVSFKRLDPIKP